MNIEKMFGVEDSDKPLMLQIGRAVTGITASIIASKLSKKAFDQIVETIANKTSETN